MSTTIEEQEELPESYPAVPGLSDSAEALAGVAWERLEAFTAYRWAPRECRWIIEGPGHWKPPLTPASIITTEVWSSAGEWEAAEPIADPRGGYFLTHSGPWRIVANVGDGVAVVPESIIEAVRRLAEYLAAEGEAGASSESIAVGSINISTRRDPAWQAKAMQYSGAGDLLRRYRRA